MSELDQAWASALATAEERARAAGRGDLTKYLTLRGANDLTRKIGRDWLLETFAALADEANLAGAKIHISQDDGHHFKIGNANMVGSFLNLGTGVRVLFVEVGWPRVPRDGFIRGGGLALANIRHRGIKSVSQHLRLTFEPGGAPRWVVRDKFPAPPQIQEADLRNHIAILLDDSRIRPASS